MRCGEAAGVPGVEDLQFRLDLLEGRAGAFQDDREASDVHAGLVGREGELDAVGSLGGGEEESRGWFERCEGEGDGDHEESGRVVVGTGPGVVRPRDHAEEKPDGGLGGGGVVEQGEADLAVGRRGGGFAGMEGDNGAISDGCGLPGLYGSITFSDAGRQPPPGGWGGPPVPVQFP